MTDRQLAEVGRAVESGCYDEAIRYMATGIAGISDEEIAIAMAVPPVRKRPRAGVKVVGRELAAIRGADWSSLPLKGLPVLIMRGSRSDAVLAFFDEH